MVTPPRRRRVGVAPARPSPAQRFTPNLRYPAMFPTETGRLVWDGRALWHATGPDRRYAVAALDATGPVPRVSIDPDQAQIHPAPGPHAAPITLTPAASARFARFAVALAARGAVRLREVARTGRVVGDVVDHLERLAALHRAGDLDDEEYARAKALVLGRRPPR